MPVNATTIQPLQEAVQNVLNQKEQEEFIYFINQYNAKRNVHDLYMCLNELLDTPAKRQVFERVQSILSGRDADTFTELLSTKQYSSLTKKRDQKAVTRPFQTLPARNARVIQRPIAQTDFTGRMSQRADLPNWEAGTGLPSQHSTSYKSVYMEQDPGSPTGLGFSIRGGSDHGVGVYVSYVEVESLAERQGLVPGDQIISVNGVPFAKISHEEAAKIIQSSKKLEMEVRNVGRVPGSFETHQKYTWVDQSGRTVSPPPEIDRAGRYETGHGVTGERKSNLMLLKNSDERKVNLAIYDHRSLGIMIRGGNEFGLGIYITGIDKSSPAEQAGLKIGDQIMDVNGNSFLDIGHREAAKLLRSSKHLMLTVKDVGKLPHTRTTYDQTQWIIGSQSPARATRSAPATPSFPHQHPPTFNEGLNGDNSIFSRGAGSQLMHTSLQTHTTHHALVEDRSRHLLNENERVTLRYYLGEYSQGHLTSSDLATSLINLLNTQAKMDLLEEIRGLLSAQDLDKFDSITSNHRVKSLKSNKKKRQAPSPPVSISKSNHKSSSISSLEHSLMYENMERRDDPLRRAIEQIRDTREVEMPFDTEIDVIRAQSPESLNGSNSSVVVVDVHRPFTHTQTKAVQSYDEMRSPSEDSGVDINGASDSSKSNVTSKTPETMRTKYGIVHKGLHNATIDSDDSQELESTWNSHAHIYSTSKLTKPKNWKEVAVAKADHRKKQKRKTKSLTDLIGSIDSGHGYLTTNGHHDDSIDSDNFFSKDNKLSHEYALKDIPISKRSVNVSPSGHKQLPTLATNSSDKSWKVADDNSEYSVTSYSRVRHIQETSFSEPPNCKLHTKFQLNEHRVSTNENWRRRQMDETDYTLPPPPDFSDSDEGKTNRFPPTKPPRKQKFENKHNDGTVVITVKKTKPTLGIAIEGGANTRQPLPRVIQIQKTGSAALSELEVGHIILEVNGVSMAGLKHQDCARAIAGAFKNELSPEMTLHVRLPEKNTKT